LLQNGLSENNRLLADIIPFQIGKAAIFSSLDGKKDPACDWSERIYERKAFWHIEWKWELPMEKEEKNNVGWKTDIM
jgi:hypothetical protein